MWANLFYIVIAGLVVWLIFHMVRHNPGSFTKENFSKSATLMGVLALALIGFIALLVVLLRHSH